uniref:Calcineurin-like phosphoesterase domain-containing protein n=1 Tax=uncultured Nocardioidaceae bacterium TaxID=253824 RepID=A0A6J4L3P3_9ACTN|nr:MAG: hypothetical protein AVDCRST_MAG46-865 [uncultured Nocardioidaceae bacterium]
MTNRSATRCAAFVLALTLVGACSGEPSTAPPAASESTASDIAAVERVRVPTLVAAGDISPDRLAGQQATSDLVLELNPTRVLVLGDQQYDNGTLEEYRAYYDPTWGRFKRRTRPTPGNHEYNTAGAAGYFSYFGARAQPQGSSYYSFDLAGWHVVSLNSNIDNSAGSVQDQWLRQDLRATSQRCVLAFWHHPRFSSGREYGNDPGMAPFWRPLYRHRADLVLNGHLHAYERFAPQTPAGEASPEGIREFVVGTGGASHYPFGDPAAYSQKRITGAFGVLRLILRPQAYLWRFIDTSGNVLDSGGPRRCH